MADVSRGRSLAPDLAYLGELGGLLQTESGVRLTAAGLDFYEQVVLGKTQFA